MVEAELKTQIEPQSTPSVKQMGKIWDLKCNLKFRSNDHFTGPDYHIINQQAFYTDFLIEMTTSMQIKFLRVLRNYYFRGGYYDI